MQKLRMAVVGARGVVGREIVAALEERGHSPEALTLLGSERSEGEEMDYAGDTLPIERATEEAFRGIQLALFATPAEVSQKLCPVAQAAGAWVVDSSAAFRSDLAVPLVFPPLGTEGLKQPFRGRIVACPSAVTSGLLLTLAPLRQAFGLKEVHVTALMSASASGNAGVKELESQTAELLSAREVSSHRFPHRLGFNLIPQVGAVRPGSLWTSEEQMWAEEVARFWPGPLRLAGTAIQVPTFYGHGLSLSVQLGRSIAERELEGLWKGGPYVKRIDQLEERIYPMPMLVTADEAVHVGRVRVVPGSDDRLLLFAVIDNASLGAARNAVEAGEALLQLQ